ncbi:hypothetical protein NC651_001515 [Populus alba x Populus x berolinensis]|nr:hypothetical protein NC651_001515 [Populus alba x Populus x berolinensis]
MAKDIFSSIGSRPIIYFLCNYILQCHNEYSLNVIF